MKRYSAQTLLQTIGFGCGAVLIVGTICLLFGSTGVGWPGSAVLPWRLQPVVDSALIGAALACAGAAYQAVLRNPLADPYLLGVSSGASLAAYLWQLPIFHLATAVLGFTAAMSQQGLAFVGAILAVGAVLAIAGRRGRIEPVTLLLVGVIVNAVNGSIFLLINAMVRDLPVNRGPLEFLVGGIQLIGGWQRAAAAILIFGGIAVLLYVSGKLNVASVGDAEAHGLGVGIHSLRWITLAAASLITAAAVSISGPIGFVGLVCPHIGRLFVGPDQRRLVPISAFIGAILLMIADAVTRYLAAENRLGTQLQIGVLTGLLGGPFFLWLLFQSKRKV
jgi:ABC-type Fe3+-siderophore transport system permease subunit